MCCPVGKNQCLEFDACSDRKPVKQSKKGSDVRGFRLVDHETGSSVLKDPTAEAGSSDRGDTVVVQLGDDKCLDQELCSFPHENQTHF